jgi:hypothetical protein
MKKALFVAALSLAMTGAAFAQAQETQPPARNTDTRPERENKRPRRLIGADIGIYMPASSSARNLFGSNWTVFRPGLRPIQVVDHTGVRVSGEILTGRQGDNRALVLPLTAEYLLPLSKKPEASTQPYASIGANYFLTQLRVDSLGIPSRLRTGGGLTGAVGVSFGPRTFIELRYRSVTEIRGLDLSGSQVRLGLRF